MSGMRRRARPRTHPVAEAVTIAAVEKQERFADAVVVAAGSSRRMGGVDKLDQEIDGRSVLQRSVEALASARHVRDVVVVASSGSPCGAVQQVVAAAQATRGRSSSAARADRTPLPLASLRPAQTWSWSTMLRARSSLLASSTLWRWRPVEHGAAIPVVPVVDSLRRVRRWGGRQDPSGAEASARPRRPRERAATCCPAPWKGTPADRTRSLTRPRCLRAMAYASRSWTERRRTSRSRSLPTWSWPGHSPVQRGPIGECGGGRDCIPVGSEDVHPFGTERRPARSAASMIPSAPRLHGHSDGDAVLHASPTRCSERRAWRISAVCFPPEAKASRGHR